MDLSNEDILELINRLLERLHQTGEDKESSHITLRKAATSLLTMSPQARSMSSASILKSLEPTNRRNQNLPVHQPVNHPNYQNH